MTTIYFSGKCFKEFESELLMNISAKSEFADWKLFWQAALDRLIADKCTIIDETYREKRAKALYSEDERQTLRQSHNNPQIIELYKKFLGEPNSHLAHELLHTHYNKNRERYPEKK